MKEIKVIEISKNNDYLKELEVYEKDGWKAITCEPINKISVEIVGKRFRLERDNGMVFEIGKYYKHTNGHKIRIIGEVETTLRGKGLLAETTGWDELIVVGTTSECTAGFTEITKEEWIKNFTE